MSRSSRPISRALRLVLSCLLVTGLSGSLCAFARVDTQDYPIAPFRLTHTSGEVGFEFDYLSESQSHEGGDKVSFSNRSFQEYLLYRLRGYVYHPRFLDFSARVKVGFLQQQIQRSDSGDGGFKGGNSNTFLDSYDLYMTFLKEHPLSISIYANRDRRAVLQLFTDRLLIESENEGLIVNWKKNPFPMDISIGRSRFKERGVESRSDAEMRFFQWVIRNEVGQWMNSELRYRFQDYQQNFQASTAIFDLERQTNYKSHDLSFYNTIYLDENRSRFLNSNLRYFRQTGTQQLENFYWLERLQLQHTPNFRTYYLASFARNIFEQTTIDTYRAEVGLEHRLYQSLDSHLDVHWRNTKFDGSEEEEKGVTGRLNYRKHTPWGYLTAGYGRTLNRYDRSGSSGTRTILDESVTLQSGLTTFLSNPGVVATSIRVTDLTGLIPYTENFDYTVETQGNRTGLRILAGGLINDGDTVLVDYEIEFISDISYVSDDQDFYVRYDIEKYLEGLSLYYRWHDLSAHDVPDVADLSILVFTDEIVGFNYNWRQLTWTEEYEKYRSNFGNYNQLRSQIEGNHHINQHLKWGWHAGLLMVEYDNEQEDPRGDKSKMVFAGTTLAGSFRNNGFWELEARARKETGRTEETALGVLGKIGMRWRKLRLEAGGRVEQFDRFNSKRDRIHAFFQIAREF
ncbi:MAG: hypothetical protein V2A74_09825 [bacterium]